MDVELGEVQALFAGLIWEHEPVGSGELVKLCETKFGWKKPTTYTVLRKLCEKGLFRNENGTVSAVISKEEFNAKEVRNLWRIPFLDRYPLLSQPLPPGKSSPKRKWQRFKG